MLFPRRTLERIVSGEIDLAFRRWRRPAARPGGRQRTVLGELAIDDVRPVEPDEISADDARRAGFGSPAELMASLREGEDRTLYRVELRFAGADPRVPLREQAELTDAELAEIIDPLHRMDARAKRAPWTRRYLDLVARRPGVVARDLAAEEGRETPAFKADVRRLKELGLTESLEVGYRLSPRGRRVLAELADLEADAQL